MAATNETLLKRIEKLERELYDSQNLIDLGMSISSNLNFNNLVESILYSCIGQIFIEKVAILLEKNIDDSTYSIHMTKGYEYEFEESDLELTKQSPIIKFLEKNPYPQEIKDLKLNSELDKDLKKISVLSAELLIPLKSKNSLNGILALGPKINGETFSDHEKELMNGLAKFSTIAVENSRLYLMATLDRMTKLYIHHYFQERLNEEVLRKQRYNKNPLSLIMSDIDHFKNFNDTYGHQQGDIVLKEIAKIFQEELRKLDIPARYGGEEFAIILPQTDLEAATLVANRLRKKIDQHPFPGQEKPLHVTISLGVAEFNPEKDKNKDDLIKRTDQALYKAKDSGRNKVVVYK